MSNLIGALILLGLGYGFGRFLEARHYKQIKEREADWLRIPAITSKTLPTNQPVATATLATGSVVVSIDYFKKFLAGLRMFFGGEVASYSSLIDRGRREALLRMKESVPDADMFINCRLMTASMFGRGPKQTVGSIEVCAYGTAIKFTEQKQLGA